MDCKSSGTKCAWILSAVFALLVSDVCAQQHTVLSWNSNRFWKHIEADNDQWVIVDLYATWCQPCRKQERVFHEVAQMYHPSVLFVRIDVDSCEDVSRWFGVEALPTLAVMRGRRIVRYAEGFHNAKQLVALIDGR